MKLCRLVAPVFLCITLFSFQPALAQFRQQGSKLVGSGAVGASTQGFSVALSRDGNTAIIGGPLDANQSGAAWVWTRSGAVWTQQQKLVGNGSLEAQGFSVAISSDGNTAVVGGAHNNGLASAAWVWTRSGAVWTQQQKLVRSDSVPGGQGGAAVSLSADGNTVLIGAADDSQGVGAAWVFTRSSGVWTQQGSKMIGSGAFGIANQGYSVSLAADGSTAIVGGFADNSSTGAAWVWIKSGGVWTQQGNKLVAVDALGRAAQGNAVSLSADGNTAIIGGVGDNQSSGAAWVWTRSGGVWSQQSKLIGSAAGPAYQGYAVSLSGDGNTAIVGGVLDNNQTGAAWVWTRRGGLWSQSDKLVGTGAVGVAYQGASVCLSGDGTTAIVGGLADSGQIGAAWVYESPVLRKRAVKH